VTRIVLVLLLASAQVLMAAQPAAACSAGPFEPADLTQLMVLGRVRSVEIGARTLITPVKPDSQPSSDGFREAIVTLDVMHTYRGDRAEQVTFIDHTSAYVFTDPRTGRDVLEYAGGSGACGTIDDDPVGMFVLIALSRGDDGGWHANRLYGAVYTDVVDHSAYRWLLERHGVPVPFLAFTSDTVTAGAVLVP
jgi:hypothetical protein